MASYLSLVAVRIELRLVNSEKHQFTVGNVGLKGITWILHENIAGCVNVESGRQMVLEVWIWEYL